MRATFTDCSTRMIVVPRRRERAHDVEQLLDDDRRQAERELVDHQQPGLGQERHGERSICCWPPDRSAAGSSRRCAQDREAARAPRSIALARIGSRSRRSIQPATPEVLGDGERREHALAAGHLDDAERGDLVGRGVGDVAAVEDDGAAIGRDDAGDRLQERGLAGAVGAEQGDDLALVDLEVDAEEHLHVAVGHVEARGRAAASSLARLALAAASRPGRRSRSRPG